MDKELHPCFNKQNIGRVSRIHLPLIKSCNIVCNYCNRSYSCPNENRPGVTSALLGTKNVLHLLNNYIKIYPDLKIVGIAGPGEALAEPEVVYNSFKIIRDNFPELKLCLSTNGFAVSENIELIKELHIDYITVTINTLNTKTASKIYVTNDIEQFISKQIKAIEILKDLKVKTKINSVVIPGINVDDLVEVAQFAQKNGVLAQNLIPFIPVKGSVFESLKVPLPEEIENIRLACSKYIKQISHCKRCRADAVGSLSSDEKINLKTKC